MSKKLEKLRALLKEHNYSGYLISTADEYLNEYVPDYAKRLRYITGFTGSNGIALLLPKTNLFFTDGRYLTQSQLELDSSYKIFNWEQLFRRQFPWRDYLSANLQQQECDQQIAYDPKLFSRKILELFTDLPLKAEENNFIDKIWQDQPARPQSKIYDYPIKFAGQTHREKLAKCDEFIKEQQASALIITDPSLLCWLLNIRAHDVGFSPLYLAKAVIMEQQAYLFSDHDNYQNIEQKPITIQPVAQFGEFIQKLTGKILFEPDYCSDYLRTQLEQKTYQYIKNPCRQWRAEKNEIEIKNMQQGHIEDAVAVCEMLAYLDREDISSLSEYDVGCLLSQYRARAKNYVMDSFPTICGFQENGALIHYRANKKSAKKLQGDGLLLIDSGGQYLGATTDITRTIAIGEVQPEYKKYYSLVLKGHIALAQAIFPAGKIEGAHLDVLARQFLWQYGKDYGHGTGHGVGNFLNVHEAPPGVGLVFSKNILQKNMVLSNEPGYYQPLNQISERDKQIAGFGIRIENMMYVCAAKEEDFLKFENLTLVPYAKNLIEINLLNEAEQDYLQKYYQQIRKTILPRLSISAQKWLEQELAI